MIGILQAELETMLAQLHIAQLRDGGCGTSEILVFCSLCNPAESRYEQAVSERYGVELSVARIKAQMRRLVSH